MFVPPLSESARAEVLARLAAIVGARHLLVEAADKAPYLTDWRGRYRGAALAVARPGTAAETAELVRVCREFRRPIVPQGGNTGLCGGATPDASGNALLIQMGRMNRIRSLDPANGALIAEAGCTLAEVQQAAETVQKLFPLSLASEGSCQIGGNLATNAGGVQVLRYGTMRDLTLGLEAVLPNGALWSGLTTLRKNNTGYDLKQMLIGSEGTLGIITAAALKLFPQAAERATLWLGVASPAAAVALLERVQAAFDASLTAFELICPLSLALVRQHFPTLPGAPRMDAPWRLLCEFSAAGADTGLSARAERFFAGAIERGWIADAVLARSVSESRAFWAWRENISEAQKREGVSIKHDIALPISRLAEFLDAVTPALQRAFPGVRQVSFGHLGDGNLHFNVSMPKATENARLLEREDAVNALVYDLVHRMSGSISAEHGIGRLKREILPRYKSETELATLRAIKSALDPEGLMNPGVQAPAITTSSVD